MTIKVSQQDRSWGIKIPQLDDVTFAELINEAKKLIPQYAPEWTDYNLHDPGITIIELLAWIAETQIFQLDQITDKMIISFLHLLGQDSQKKEKLKDAIMRSRVDLKKLYKAVTLDDFERLAIETPSVVITRAKALWNKDRVQIIILPNMVQTEKKNNRHLTVEEIKIRVCRYLDKRRILTTLIEVIDPVYVTVSIEATIKIKPYSSIKVVIERIKNVLNDFFNQFSWPFGRNVYASEVIAKIENVDGVDSIEDLELFADNNSRKHIVLTENALTKSGEHQIRIIGS